MSDHCECLFNHEAAMRRLLSLVRFFLFPYSSFSNGAVIYFYTDFETFFLNNHSSSHYLLKLSSLAYARHFIL